MYVSTKGSVNNKKTKKKKTYSVSLLEMPSEIYHTRCTLNLAVIIYYVKLNK